MYSSGCRSPEKEGWWTCAERRGLERGLALPSYGRLGYHPRQIFEI